MAEGIGDSYKRFLRHTSKKNTLRKKCPAHYPDFVYNSVRLTPK